MIQTETKIYYRAMLSRDRRFDGTFFAGVTTTGVYCRPVCPAPKPLLKNVRFYSTAAGAEEAGFRPCLRCRPETAPGTPAWRGTSATVSRALRLIEAGVLDSGGVPALAGQLGVGDRHLRRLFMEHLGAPPHAIALVKRLDLARRLVDETNLNMSEIALSSGFESIRRFNDSFRRRFGIPPSASRKRLPNMAAAGSAIVLHLPYRPPYDWQSMLGYLRDRALPGVEHVDGGAYSRTIAFERAGGTISVEPLSERALVKLSIACSSVSGSLSDIIRRVRSLFDLDADPLAIYGHLGSDRYLAHSIRKHPGLRVAGCWDGFELAVRALVGQQVSIKAANTIAGRIVKRWGRRVGDTVSTELSHLFPEPGVLARARLDGLGMPSSRARALHLLSRFIASGDIRLDGIMPQEMVRKKLREIPGIGDWTIDYICLRSLHEPDAFPASDLGLRRVLYAQGIRNEQTEGWRPWRSYAAVQLWKIYSNTHANNHGKE